MDMEPHVAGYVATGCVWMHGGVVQQPDNGIPGGGGSASLFQGEVTEGD
jgi:hypothetical protein